jgi:hypothetical protein
MGVSKKEISPCPIDVTLGAPSTGVGGHHPLAIAGRANEDERIAEEYP